ncbi:SagB/ThcOx family dehydrogenase [Rhizobium beringeri]|uniref:SagB/ThcOx family dehydrogenase n=1 Tax=Rhizobium beringeri TaxID=3019934 RepID=UPI003CEBEEED
MSDEAESRDFFVVVRDGKLLAYDYIAQRQFHISLDALAVLLSGPELPPGPAADQVKRAGLNHAFDAPWNWDVVSKIFHFGTYLRRSIGSDPSGEESALRYVENCESIMDSMPGDAFATVRGIDPIDLGEGTADELGTLKDALEQRITNRRFTREQLDFRAVATIIRNAFQYREHDGDAYKKMGMFTPTMRRTAPSGGSLQSCECYLIADRVSQLGAGIYHYQSHNNNLARVADLSDGFSFAHHFGDQRFSDDVSAAIVITCRFDKLMWKYRNSRSYRVALLDAGHLSQVVQMVATSVDIRTWPTAAFYDQDISTVLGLKSEIIEYPLMVIGLGSGNPNPFDRDLGDGFT